jgi:16S rRNA (adenine1518-N6/adenine1519-N6)-dimethyltransferase
MDPAIELAPLNVPALLRNYDLHPKKGLGQNFLVEEAFLNRIVEIADIDPQGVVLEIGAGIGSLTRHLARAARRVVAVEIDTELFPLLKQILAPFTNINIRAGDILNLDPGSLVDADQYTVVANIPYYITSAVIRHLLEGHFKPLRMVLTVQKEVAMRICAVPGDMSLLALSVQLYGRPRMAAQIPAGAFYPAPDIDSSVVRIDLFPQPVIPQDQIEIFFNLARAGFGQKRKQLRNSLARLFPAGSLGAIQALQTAGIDPQRRAETLSLEEWGRLTKIFAD